MFRIHKFEIQSLQIQLLTWYQVLLLPPSKKLSMRRTLLQAPECLCLFQLSGCVPEPNSLLPSAQLYHNIWAKFILFVIDFSGFHHGLFGVPLSTATTVISIQKGFSKPQKTLPMLKDRAEKLSFYI